jgi:hypothetical protein
VNFFIYLNKLKYSFQEVIIDEEIVAALMNNLNTVKAFYLLEKKISLLNQKLMTKIINDEFLATLNRLLSALYLLGFKFNLSSYSFADKLLIGQ